jgi:hypothetical protein
MRRWTLAGPPDWAAASPALVPLLARRSAPTALARATTVTLDPGLRVGFGVDVGPMFLHVTDDLLARWEIDLGELTRRAIANLRERSRSLRQGAATDARVGMTRIAALQSPEGWASSLLLAPDLLPRWFGANPRVFIAPSRNMLVALPPTADARLARWLHDSIAAQLPDALDVPPLRWIDGTLGRLEPDERPAPRSQGSRRFVWRSPAVAGRRRGQGAPTTWYTPPSDRSVT